MNYKILLFLFWRLNLIKEINKLNRINHYLKSTIKDSISFFDILYEKYKTFDVNINDIISFCNTQKLSYLYHCQLVVFYNKLDYFKFIILIINKFLYDFNFKKDRVCFIAFNLLNDNNDKFLTFIDLKFLFKNELLKNSKLIIKDLFLKLLKYKYKNNLKNYYNIDKEIIIYEDFIEFCNKSLN